MLQQPLGYKFRVLWKSTGLTDTISARGYDQARRAIVKRYSAAVAHQFVGTAPPVPPTTTEAWEARLPRKVF